MSETTPDPADVHTGTDRVELTDAERDLRSELERSGRLLGLIGSEVRRIKDERDDVRAELAAANVRCAELEGTYWPEALGKVIKERDALSAELTRTLAVVEEQEATLDRVTALADEWEAAEVGVPSPDTALSGNECAAALRAALTPEGKP